MLAQTEKNDGGRPTKNQSDGTTGFKPAPTLAKMGITKDQSSRYQQLAAMPDDHFETAAIAIDTIDLSEYCGEVVFH